MNFNSCCRLPIPRNPSDTLPKIIPGHHRDRDLPNQWKKTLSSEPRLIVIKDTCLFSELRYYSEKRHSLKSSSMPAKHKFLRLSFWSFDSSSLNCQLKKASRNCCVLLFNLPILGYTTATSTVKILSFPWHVPCLTLTRPRTVSQQLLPRYLYPLERPTPQASI